MMLQLGSGSTLLFISALLICVSGQCGSIDTPAGCSYDCQSGQLTCERSSHTVVLKIDQCSDPLELKLDVFWNETGILSTQSYQVGGPVEVSQCRSDGVTRITTTYARNASHLNFSAVGNLQGATPTDLVSQVSLSLDPHSCMCQSLDTVAENFHLSVPGFSLPFNYTCAKDEACSHVQCTFSNSNDDPESAGSYNLFVIIDPCEEAMILAPGNDSVVGGEGQIVFNRTESREIGQGDGTGYTTTIYMTITNYNYSMEFGTQVSLPNVPFRLTVYEPTKITLDRSVCPGDLTYYEGEPSPLSACTDYAEGTSPPPVYTINTEPPSGTPAHPHTTPLPHGHTTPISVTTDGIYTPRPTLPTFCPGLQVPIECQPLANCSGITCSAHFTSSVLVVDKCSDPLTAELTVFGAQSSVVFFKTKNFIGGPLMSYSDGLYHVQYSRNATHLMFSVTGIFEGDIAERIVYIDSFPLDSHNCMCESLSAIASTSSSPLIPSLTCQRDDQCRHVECHVSEGDGLEFEINVEVLPCLEALVVVSTQGQIEEQVFNQTEDRSIIVANGSLVTMSVILNNHNFSMDVQVHLNAIISQQSAPVFILPYTKVQLDRSSCSEQQLQFYTGVAPEHVTLVGGYSPTPPGVSITAIAVSVPLVLILALALIVSVTVCVVLGLRSKRRRVGAYTFSELKEDDNEEI